MALATLFLGKISSKGNCYNLFDLHGRETFYCLIENWMNFSCSFQFTRKVQGDIVISKPRNFFMWHPIQNSPTCAFPLVLPTLEPFTILYCAQKYVLKGYHLPSCFRKFCWSVESALVRQDNRSRQPTCAWRFRSERSNHTKKKKKKKKNGKPRGKGRNIGACILSTSWWSWICSITKVAVGVK